MDSCLAPQGINTPGLGAYATPISPQAVQTKIPHRNTQRGHTIWWADKDQDTFPPKPGALALDPDTNPLLKAATVAASKAGAPETWSPKNLVETKVATHAQGEETPPTPKRLHPSLKQDALDESKHEQWAVHYIVPLRTTRNNEAAKITVTCHLPHTTEVCEPTARNVLVTHRQNEELYTK